MMSQRSISQRIRREVAASGSALLLLASTAHAQSIAGAYAPKNVVVRAATATHGGGVFCRGEILTDPPLPVCRDGAGVPIPCTETPGARGITIHVTDAGSLDVTWHADPEECRTTRGLFLLCHGNGRRTGSGRLKKATIRERPGGRFPFKLAPRGLEGLSGPFVPPIHCDLTWDSDGRIFTGTFGPDNCDYCVTRDTPRASLYCTRCR